MCSSDLHSIVGSPTSRTYCLSTGSVACGHLVLAMALNRMLKGRRWRLPRLLWRAYRLWDREDCIDLSAAFAYHSLQSLFPILLIALGVASRVLGRVDGLTDNLMGLAEQVLPPSVLPLVSSTLTKLYRQGTGAGVVGAVFLLISATNAYLSLQRGADRLWGFRPILQPPATWVQPVLRFIRADRKSTRLNSSH